MTEATEVSATPLDPQDPALPDQPANESIESAVAAFRRQLEGQVSVPASVVQDGLLDLWGLLPEGDRRTVVERWLTETLERSLYQVTDVDSRLDTVVAPQD